MCADVCQLLFREDHSDEAHTHEDSRQGSQSKGRTGALQCIAEERLPNITTVQDVVAVPGTQEQLVCGFQVQNSSSSGLATSLFKVSTVSLDAMSC